MFVWQLFLLVKFHERKQCAKMTKSFPVLTPTLCATLAPSFYLVLSLSLCSHPDPGVLADIQKWGESLKNYSSQYVGQTLVYLNGTFKECRFRECNLGNLICDAMVRVTLSVRLRVSYHIPFADLMQYITLPCTALHD